MLRIAIRAFSSPKLWVALVLCGALFAIAIGIWGESFVAGDVGPISNAIRGFQWETLAAGIFGLAGGLFVIVATRNQMAQSERIAMQQQEDFLLSDINAQMGEIQDFCVACQEFIDRAENLGRLDEQGTDEHAIAKRIVAMQDSRDGEFPILKYINIADSLKRDGRVPAVALDDFDEVKSDLQNLRDAWQSTADGERLPETADRLRESTEKLRDALKKHKKRILEARQL